MRIFPLEFSVAHRLPSGPATMPVGESPGYVSAPGVGYSVIAPLVVILPIADVLLSVNQRFPSGPATMSVGPLSCEG